MDNNCYFCGNYLTDKHVTIKDGTKYCEACSRKAKIVKNYFNHKWNKYEANNYLQYHKFAQENYRPIFNYEFKLGENMACDSTNGLFYFSDYNVLSLKTFVDKAILEKDIIKPIDDDTLILSIDNVEVAYIREWMKYRPGYTQYTTHYSSYGTYTDTKEVDSKVEGYEVIVVDIKEPELRIVQNYNEDDSMSDVDRIFFNNAEYKFSKFLNTPQDMKGVHIFQLSNYFKNAPINTYRKFSVSIDKSYAENISEFINQDGILDVYKLKKVNDKFAFKQAFVRNADVYNDFVV